MRALITGAAGFIGSTLARRLVAEGHDVIGIDRFSTYYPEAVKRDNVSRIPAPFQLVEADLVSADLDSVLSDRDVVFHLAARPGVTTSWGSEFASYVSDNILATQALLDASVRAGVGRVVYASSSSVYGERVEFPASEDAVPRPFSPYGVSKLAAEHLCALVADNFGLSTVSLRLFTVYGPAQRPDMAFSRFIRAALVGDQIVINGDGEQVRDFTYVDDVVDALVSAAGAQVPPGSVFNVSGGSSASVNDVVAALRDVVGEVQVAYRPRDAGDVIRTGGDVTRATSALNWSPRVELRDGIGRQVDWMRSR